LTNSYNGVVLEKSYPKFSIEDKHPVSTATVKKSWCIYVVTPKHVQILKEMALQPLRQRGLHVGLLTVCEHRT